jgi:acetyl esterase/lipase
VVKKAVIVGLLLACVGLGWPFVVAATPVAAAATVTIQSNLCYQHSASGTSCMGGTGHEFDAYLPAGMTQATPGVILIHGGGFTGGDKMDLANLGNRLAADGMAAFSINYQLDDSTTVGFPVESQDVMTAISYVRAHAASFDVDPGRLASFGTSAGATLAVYSAMKASQSDPSAQVLADVGWSGGYDFTVADSGAVDPSQLQNVEDYLGCSDPTDPTGAATALAASAISLVGTGDPPTLLANSTDYKVGCEIVSPSQAEEMAADLTNAGVSVQLDLNNRCAHANGYVSVEFAPTAAFLEAHLYPTATSVVLPSAGASVSGTAVLDATASPGLDAVSYDLTGGTLSDQIVATATPTLYGWVAQWNTTSVQNGTYQLQSVGTYQGGDTTTGGTSATSPPVTVTVANAAPSTTVLIPGTGSTISGASSLLDASASANVTGVTYELSGGSLADQVIATGSPTIYGWLAQWNTTSVPNGTYQLQSVAIGPGGVSGTSGPVSVTVANAPPSTTVLIPSTGSIISGTSSLLDASASANVTGVTYEVSGGALSDQVIATGSPTIYGWLALWNTTSVPNGTYQLQSVAAYPGGVGGTSPPVAVIVAN